MSDVRKGRRTLVLVALVFAAPILIASLLALSGWMPSGRRNYGELVDPPHRVESTTALAGGDAFTWTTPKWHWTLVLRIPEACDASCRERLDQVANARISLGRHAEKLRIVVDRALPSSEGVLAHAGGVYVLSSLPDELASRIPAARQDLTLALVDPAGYLMLRYPEQSDLRRVRKDLGKLIR